MNRSGRRGGDGWTLIEALVAVALTAVLASVVASTSFAVHRILRDRERRAAQGVAVRAGLLRLAADLERACEPPDGTAFTLNDPSTDPAELDLQFYAYLPVPGESDLRWAHIRELRVLTIPRETGDGLRWLRIERPTTGPEALAGGRTSEIPGRVEALLVEVSDGTNWVSAWPAPEGASLPAAARARLAYRGATGMVTAGVETVIRAGAPVKPRLERRLAPSAGP